MHGMLIDKYHLVIMLHYPIAAEKLAYYFVLSKVNSLLHRRYFRHFHLRLRYICFLLLCRLRGCFFIRLYVRRLLCLPYFLPNRRYYRRTGRPITNVFAVRRFSRFFIMHSICRRSIMLGNKCFRRKCAKFDAAFVPLAKRHIGNSFHGINLGDCAGHFVLNIYYFLYLRRVKIKRQIFLRLLQRLTALSNERPHYPVLVPEAYLQLVRMNVYVYLFGRYSYMQHSKREAALHKTRIIRPLQRI